MRAETEVTVETTVTVRDYCDSRLLSVDTTVKIELYCDSRDYCHSRLL